MSVTASAANAGKMQDILALQKRTLAAKGPPSAALRRDRLTRCISLLLTHQDDLVAAIQNDFGARSRDMTMLTDIAAAIGPLKQARAELERWRPAETQVTRSARRFRRARGGALSAQGAWWA